MTSQIYKSVSIRNTYNKNFINHNKNNTLTTHQNRKKVLKQIKRKKNNEKKN